MRIKGTYISVALFHLLRYLDEQVYRYDNRGLADDGERFQLVLSPIAGSGWSLRSHWKVGKRKLVLGGRPAGSAFRFPLSLLGV